MNFFTFTKLGRTLLLSGVVAVSAVCWAGCGGDDGGNDNPANNNGNNNNGNNNNGGVGTLSCGSRECKSAKMPDGKTWMTENLNVPTEEGSWCYGEGGETNVNGEWKTLSSSEIQVNCNTYGRLYTWDAAKTVCPTGWHLPTRDEWGALAIAAGGTGTYGGGGNGGTPGKVLKSTDGWNSSGNGTDDFGFSALPGGVRVYHNGGFGGVGREGHWWTATEGRGIFGWRRYMDYYHDNVGEVWNEDVGACSVRCVQD